MQIRIESYEVQIGNGIWPNNIWEMKDCISSIRLEGVSEEDDSGRIQTFLMCIFFHKDSYKLIPNPKHSITKSKNEDRHLYFWGTHIKHFSDIMDLIRNEDELYICQSPYDDNVMFLSTKVNP